MIVGSSHDPALTSRIYDLTPWGKPGQISYADTYCNTAPLSFRVKQIIKVDETTTTIPLNCTWDGALILNVTGSPGNNITDMKIQGNTPNGIGPIINVTKYANKYSPVFLISIFDDVLFHPTKNSIQNLYLYNESNLLGQVDLQKYHNEVKQFKSGYFYMINPDRTITFGEIPDMIPGD